MTSPPSSSTAGSRLRLALTVGKSEESIVFDRGGAAATRSAGIAAQGMQTGAMTVPEGTPVKLAASLPGGTVPAGYRIHVVWYGFPRSENVCVSTRGAGCSGERKFVPGRPTDAEQFVCAQLEDIMSGTSSGLGPVCVVVSVTPGAPKKRR